MGAFLTGKARIEQTSKRRIWKLLENELFMDNDGSIIICPRNMYTDGYTIPLWIDFVAGGGFDWDERASFFHDLACYCREIPMLTVSLNDLFESDILTYDNDRKCYLCADIPPAYIKKKKMNKLQANNLLYRCMAAAGVPLLARLIIRAGTVFNIGWFIDLWTHKVFNLELDKMYSEAFWDKHVRGK